MRLKYLLVPGLERLTETSHKVLHTLLNLFNTG
jgi:hypothetical protein